VTVVSGKLSLQEAAVNAQERYSYQPATRNGKPVLAHAGVTIQFLFEP